MLNRDLDNFRVLLVLALTTLVVAMYVSFFALSPPRELEGLYEWQGYGAVTSYFVEEALFWIYIGLVVTSLATMFFFWRYSRHLMLAAMFLLPVQNALGGIWISNPVEDTFWVLHNLFVTLAIGMALFHPPVRAEFARSPSVAPLA